MTVGLDTNRANETFCLRARRGYEDSIYQPEFAILSFTSLGFKSTSRGGDCFRGSKHSSKQGYVSGSLNNTHFFVLIIEPLYRLQKSFKRIYNRLTTSAATAEFEAIERLSFFHDTKVVENRTGRRSLLQICYYHSR